MQDQDESHETPLPPPQLPPANAEQASFIDASNPTPTQPNLALDGFSESPRGPLPVIHTPWYTALPKPLPLWACIGSSVAVILVLLVTGSDWASGAMRVGIVAGILALVVLLVTVVRLLLD